MNVLLPGVDSSDFKKWQFHWHNATPSRTSEQAQMLCT
jgi:hypothetical protein